MRLILAETLGAITFPVKSEVNTRAMAFIERRNDSDWSVFFRVFPARVFFFFFFFMCFLGGFFALFWINFSCELSSFIYFFPS